MDEDEARAATPTPDRPFGLVGPPTGSPNGTPLDDVLIPADPKLFLSFSFKSIQKLIKNFSDAPNAGNPITQWTAFCTDLIDIISGPVLHGEASDDSSTLDACAEIRKQLGRAANNTHAWQRNPPQEASPPPLPTPPPSLDSTLANYLHAFQRSMSSQISRLEHHITRTASRQEKIPRPVPNTALSSGASTYASTAASPPSENAAATKLTKPAPRKPPSPVRFVVRYKGAPPAADSRPLSLILSKKINRKLSSIPTAEGLQVIGTHWNPSGNLILTFPPSANPKLIAVNLPSIREALDLDPDHTISRDTRWSKVVLAGVLAREVPDGPVFSNEDLLDSLSDMPIVSKLTVTQPPSWIRPSDQIQGLKSSVTFAFEDPDGSLIKEVLKTQFFMFGAPVPTKRWIDKPKLRQCSNCWGLGHVAAHCNTRTKCRRCGDRHSEQNHRSKCGECKTANLPSEQDCPHSAKCVNCSGPHIADSADCPERRKYAVPSSMTQPISPADADVIIN